MKKQPVTGGQLLKLKDLHLSNKKLAEEISEKSLIISKNNIEIERILSTFSGKVESLTVDPELDINQPGYTWPTRIIKALKMIKEGNSFRISEIILNASNIYDKEERDRITHNIRVNLKYMLDKQVFVKRTEGKNKIYGLIK